MDFLALPRRDLQALCKRNDIRANMTNAAMAEALRALPKVEGIEEYVKVLQPVAVPQTVNEEQKPKKQEGPLPRGRRATAKSSEPTEPEKDKEKLEDDATRQSNKEDAQAPGVGRRGASTRPVPAVPLPPRKAVAEEDGQEDNLKPEARRDNAPAPIVARRGASRRGRPSPAVAVPEAESEVAVAEEEQRREVVVEDLKREATMDDAPTLGVGRRGASRRARAAPSVAALADKLVAEEEPRAMIPRGAGVKATGTSSEPIRLDDSDHEEKDYAKPVEQTDAQILGVGRRGGASRRAQVAPAVAAPEANAEEEQRAPVPRGRRVKANSTELIRLDDSKEEKNQDTKPEEEKGDAPAIAVGRRGASRRAPAPSEAPAARRSTAASKAEAGDVAVEAVPIRATRKRKPTMKAAAAAAEEKAPRRATRRGDVMRTLLQQEVQEEPQGVLSDAEAVGAPDVVVEAVPIRETRHRKPTMKAVAVAAKAEDKAPPRATRRGTVTRTVLQPGVQEEPQEAVGAPVSYQQCDALEELAEESDPQKEELNEVDTPKQDQDQDVVMIEDEKLMEETPAEETSMTDQECTDNSEMQEQQVDDEKCLAPLATLVDDEQEAMGAPVSYQRCDALEELAEESDPQKEELNDVDAPKQDEDQEEEPSITDQECTDNSEMQEKQVDDEKCLAPLATLVDEDQDVVIIEDEKLMEDTPAEESSVTDHECTDKSEMQEQQVDDEKCHAPLATQEESPILGLVSMVTELAFEDDGSEAPLTAMESDANHESVIGSVREEISEVDTQDYVVCKEKEHTDIAELQAGIVDEATFLDCSGNISQVAGEETNEEVNTEDGLSCQVEGDVVVDKVLHDSVDDTILLDCSSDISLVEVEKEGNITSEMPENQAALDEDGDKPNGVVIGDRMSQATVTDEVVQDEKGVLITDEMPRGTAGMHDMEDDQFETVFVQVDQVVTADMEVNTKDGLSYQEEGDVVVDKVLHELVDNTILLNCSSDISWVEVEMAGNITSEMPENQATLDEDGDKLNGVVIGDSMSQATVTDEVVNEKKHSTITMDSDEQKEVIGIVTEVPKEVTGTDDEVVEEKAVVITEDMPNQGTVPNITHTMDECLKENNFGTDFGHGNEQKKAITADIEPEVSRAQEGGARREKALLDEVTESLSKSAITMEPSVCKNSSEKNTAEPMAVLEEKRVKVASESEDLTKLSLGQLRAKIKEKLNAKKNKEAKKRVALARVDENVCRSHSKGAAAEPESATALTRKKLALNSDISRVRPDSMQLW